MSKVAVVILNWNGKHWLKKFLPNVLKHSAIDGVEVIVADNASTDDSMAFLQEKHPLVRTIKLDYNSGYTGGYNRALKQIESEYYVLLNSDIEVTPGWLEEVIGLMDHQPNIAACQPKILAYNNKEYFEYAGAAGGYIDQLGYPYCRGRIFDTLEKDEGQYNEAQPVFWATGACLFVRAKDFHDVGGLDEGFFAHMEEIDLCWRLQNQSKEVWVQPSSTVYHVGGGTLPQGNPRKTYLNFRNNMAMVFKNMPFPQVFLVIVARLLLDGLAGLHLLLKGDWKGTLAIIEAHFAFYMQIPRLLRKRKENLQHRRLSELHGAGLFSIVWNYFIGGKKTFTDLQP